MHRTRIKICGVMRRDDAVAAANCGADAIGLIMLRTAKRFITRERACEILDALPPFVTPVALFVNATPREILDTTSDLRVRHVQLHGDESPEQIAKLHSLAVLKAIRVTRDGFVAELNHWREMIRIHKLTNLIGLVLETPSDGQAGGTGVANDWNKIRQHREAHDFDGLPPLIAAGGLTPETVGQVVQSIRPWAVDVSSGVEERLGAKSPARIKAFCAAVGVADEAMDHPSSRDSQLR